MTSRPKIGSLFFDELGALGVMNVALAGGEPFIRPDLPALLESIVRLTENYNGRISGGAGPLAEAWVWRAMEQARVERAPAFPNAPVNRLRLSNE